MTYPLYPGRIRDISRRGRWTRDYSNERRFFQFRYYYHRFRMPWLAWVMFS